MRSKSATPTNRAAWGQQGGFSPFMFGLVLGMSMFSALSMQWARKELARYEEQQLQRTKDNAQDVADALNFAILSEDTQTYSEDYSLERARQYTDTTARTQGGQDYMVTTRTNDERMRYGQAATTVAITGGDDTLLRSQMHRSGSSEDILRTNVGNKQAVAVYDTTTARDRQVRTSNQRMEVLAEQIYAFYAGKYRFPTDSEFTSLNGGLDLHDAWGREFTYKPDKDNQTGTLSFTTPWNYTQTLILSLKDESKTSESGNDENEE
ncbi:MAG: hypothetical protein EON60_09455 [Alphaproteobacteria bacterium]|nr:MAG: hypothetical protein EON60_09455 [Alphaproteobacteria bacterium]